MLPFRPLLALAASLALTACTGGPPPAPIRGLPPVSVMASAETVPVGTSAADAADDPAIWVDPANPAHALIIGTDKKAGIHVYDLAGQSLSFTPAGLVNNIDVVGDHVGASDRNDRARAHVALYRLDSATAALRLIGRVPAGPGEAYGFCFADAAAGQPPRAALIMKDGGVRVGDILGLDSANPTFRLAWEHKLPTQAEGCVFDRDTLYVGEEDAGIWAITAPTSTTKSSARMVAPIDNQRLVADVEGLAVIDHGGKRYLLASSQGDNAFAVFILPDVAYVGRFEVAAGSFGATSETDGIAAMAGQFGAAFPGGLFIAQDGQNLPAAQNFKLVRWDVIATALGIAAE